MARNIFAGGGVNAFMGDNNPLYVQNMNSLKAAFTDLQNDIAGASNPIGTIIMWGGDPAAIPTEVPAGYAVANGASVPTATYAELFAIIGYRYGGAGANFNLPNLTTRIPQGTVGAPVVPTTQLTSVSSVVDAHTHTVNSSLSLGNLNTHTHSGGVLTAGSVNTTITVPGAPNTTIAVNSNFNAGNADAHSHTLFFNSAGANSTHAHTNSGQSANHTHTYFKPNTGANNSGNNQNADHTHTVNANTTDHSHAIIGNTGNTAAGVNSNFSAGNAASHSHSGGVLTAGNTNTSITAPGAPNANSTIALTAGDASTINASTLTHTHNFAITELVFIIRVS